MSFLIASPEALAATATYLTGIGSAISAANAVAAAPTTEILAAGTDEVSTAISALFGAHAQAYQALSAHVAAFHDQFVHTLTAGAGSYMAAEAAAASPLQALQLELLNAINAPTLALLGRPLIGDARCGAGERGGRRGRRILIGNGGTGGASDLAGTGRGGVGGRAAQGLIESTNTKIRLLTRIAFGFRSPQALIALAMLTLAGHRPTLPGRHNHPQISQ